MELLCVIAIIGILVSILLPTLNAARKSSLKTQTKAQFYEYIFALEAYFHEYGKYPYFFNDRGEVNLREYGEEFVKALSGRGRYPDYEELTGHERRKLNPKGIAFYRFGKSEFNDEGMVVDGFGNPNIRIFVDQLGKGLLKIGDQKVAAKIAMCSQKESNKGYEDVQSW